MPQNEDKEKKSFDKSVIQCYNCQKYGNFAYECRSNKKEQDDQAYVSKSTQAVAATTSYVQVVTSSLLMGVVEEASDLILHGFEGALSNPPLWYLDTRATNHMTGHQSTNVLNRQLTILNSFFNNQILDIYMVRFC